MSQVLGPITHCLYSRHVCGRERLSGFDFCLDHILEDKSAPFKQCNFHLKANKRCHRPAPKIDRRDGYCADHARRALIGRQKVASRKRPIGLVHQCLEDLSHYGKASKVVNGTKAEASSTSTEVSNENQGNILDQVHDNAKSISHSAIDNENVDTDEEIPTVEETWSGDEDSEADSVDSDLDDPLKHAGAYSAEEVIRIMRDKLIRLQKLYIDQFQRLQYVLKEERRLYLRNVRQEKEENFMSIHTQPKRNKEDIAAYEKVKTLSHYIRPQGVDAVLQHQLMEKRVRASEGPNYKPSVPIVAKCVHSITTNTKCGEVCVPMTKYCLKHIMDDPNQILFRQCNFVTKADGPCETPIPDVLDNSTCVYHVQVPATCFDEKAYEASKLVKQEEQQQEQQLNVSLDEPPQKPVSVAAPTNVNN